METATLSHRGTVAPDTNTEPIVTFNDDDLIWIVRCPSDECGKVYAHVRLSNAMRRYCEHRDLPVFVDPQTRPVDLDD